MYHKSVGGLANIAMTGILAFGAGSLFPMRFGKKSGIDTQAQISSKNIEIQKLKSMVYEYEFQIAELKKALFQSEQDALKRDYEEFKQPDANGDDVISRMEVCGFICGFMFGESYFSLNFPFVVLVFFVFLRLIFFTYFLFKTK